MLTYYPLKVEKFVRYDIVLIREKLSLNIRYYIITHHFNNSAFFKIEVRTHMFSPFEGVERFI